MKYYTLKLDSAYRPLAVIDSIKAFGMILSSRAEVLINHDDVELCPGYYAPSIIRVTTGYIRKNKFTKPCNRKNIIIRDLYYCQYCGIKYRYSDLTVDHILPRSRGGIKEWTNLVASCKPCNYEKADRTPEEADMILMTKPNVPTFNFFEINWPGKMKEEWLDYKGKG